MQRRRADGREALGRRYLGQNVFMQLEHLAVQRKHRGAAERIPAGHSSWMLAEGCVFSKPQTSVCFGASHKNSEHITPMRYAYRREASRRCAEKTRSQRSPRRLVLREMSRRSYRRLGARSHSHERRFAETSGEAPRRRCARVVGKQGMVKSRGWGVLKTRDGSVLNPSTTLNPDPATLNP